MFTAIATMWRALNELFSALEITCRSARKGANLMETMIDKEIAEAQAKAESLAE